MGVRINELTEAVQANGVDILELEQGAQSKKISIARAVGKIATAEAAAAPYTVTNNDVNIDVQFTTGAVNLPAATGTGRNLRIIKTDSTGGTVTITPDGSDTIEGNSSVALYAQYDYIELLDIASGVWKVVDHKIAQVTTTDTSYTVQPLDETVNLNFETGTVSLPAAVGSGRKIKLIKTHATENTITISANGSDTIVGESSITLNDQYNYAILKDIADGFWFLEDYLETGTDGGTWYKYANGQMYQYKLGVLSIPAASSGKFTATWTYPKGFAEAPIVMVNADVGTDNTGNFTEDRDRVALYNIWPSSVKVIAVVGAYTASIYDVMAIGRWR